MFYYFRLIVGIINSSVAKQYLLGQVHPVGSFILRMQYYSPSEICASSVQLHPQSGATFVDHLTIPKEKVFDDRSLMEYLANSAIHQLLLPGRQLCAPSVLSNFNLQTSNQNQETSYRTTDQQSQRTNEILLHISEPNNNNNSNFMNNFDEINIEKKSEPAEIEIEKKSSTLDPKVYAWLANIFDENSSLFQEILVPFENERVTFSSLEYLEADDLKEMGIAVGPRKQLLEELVKLQ